MSRSSPRRDREEILGKDCAYAETKESIFNMKLKGWVSSRYRKILWGHIRNRPERRTWRLGRKLG